MKITALEVEGFGAWSGLKLESLSSGLNVLFGPNEAGKTTLLEFIRSVLYGFSPLRRRYLPPLAGGRAGGSIVGVSAQGRFQIHRYDEPPGAGGAGAVTLLNADGTPLPEDSLNTLLAHVDETVFNHVFAVGLADLQQLGVLNGTEAAAMLYRLSLGFDRVSLVEVMREVEAARNRILDQHGGSCEVMQLVAQQERLRAERDEACTLTRRYARLAAQRDQIDRETARLQEDLRQLRLEAVAVRVALAQYERWHRRRALDEQLALLGDAGEIPEVLLRRLDAIGRRIVRQRHALVRVGHRQREIRAQLAGLGVNRALWRFAPRIEALKEQTSWIATLQKQVAELETEIGQLESQAAAERQRLGLGDARGAGGWSALSSRALAALRDPARKLGRLRRQLQQAQHQAASARHTAQTLSAQIQSALSARSEHDLASAVERVSGQVTQLRRRVQLDERIDQLGRTQVELDEESHRLLEHQLLPVPLVIGLGALFVLGVVLLMAGLFIPRSLLGAMSWPLALLGVAAAGAAVAAKYLIERTTARRIDECQRQIHMVQLQLKQAKQERQALDEQLPRGAGAITSRLQAAEQDLAALEELVPLDARRQAALQEAEGAAKRARQAEEELAAAERRWREALLKAGLPEHLTSKQARDLLLRSDDVADVQRRLERRYEEFQQRTSELESLKARLAQLASDCQVTPQSSEPVQQVRQLAEELAQQEARRKRRDTLRAHLRRLERRRERLRTAIRRLRRRRRELLRGSGVSDEEALRKKLAEAARAEELRRERQALQREIEAALAGSCDEQTVAAQLEGTSRDDLEARLGQLETRVHAAEAHLQQRFEARGRLHEQLKVLAEDRTPATTQLALGVLAKKLQVAIDRWRALALTSHILQSLRAKYQRERQPQTLLDASGYLEQLTEGRYRRVWTPLEEDVLLVDDAGGKALSLELLSQGLREQLFLSLRLALVHGYARRGVELPMVLDDVLVNFDAQRAKAACAVLRDFARAGHQLFVFTCHEHIAKLFQNLQVEVAELPHDGDRLAAFTSADPDDTPGRRRAKRRVRPEPPSEPVPQPLVAQLEPALPPEQQSPAGEPFQVERSREHEGPPWGGWLTPWDEPWGEEPGEERENLYPSRSSQDEALPLDQRVDEPPEDDSWRPYDVPDPADHYEDGLGRADAA